MDAKPNTWREGITLDHQKELAIAQHLSTTAELEARYKIMGLGIQADYTGFRSLSNFDLLRVMGVSRIQILCILEECLNQLSNIPDADVSNKAKDCLWNNWSCVRSQDWK